jgi:DNA helicase HerA-like ATPase
MLNKLIQYSYHLEQSKEIRLFCIIDEAHRMVYPGPPLDTLFREARKYGIGVILASQRATDFNENILANASSIISLKQNLRKDARHIAKNKWADEEQLLNLDPGQGFIRLPKTSKKALAITIVPRDKR